MMQYRCVIMESSSRGLLWASIGWSLGLSLTVEPLGPKKVSQLVVAWFFEPYLEACTAFNTESTKRAWKKVVNSLKTGTDKRPTAPTTDGLLTPLQTDHVTKTPAVNTGNLTFIYTDQLHNQPAPHTYIYQTTEAAIINTAILRVRRDSEGPQHQTKRLFPPKLFVCQESQVSSITYDTILQQ